ncbi:MAG: hypothetical protein ACFFA0_16540 [Promethearchaeota archaeon]
MKTYFTSSISPTANNPVAKRIDSTTEFLPKGDSSQIITKEFTIIVHPPGPKNISLSD